MFANRNRTGFILHKVVAPVRLAYLPCHPCLFCQDYLFGPFEFSYGSS